MSTVVDAINQSGLMTILEVRQTPHEEFDIIGRVTDDQANQWGTVMRNVLLQALRTKNEDAIDFSRVYRLARRDMMADTGLTVRNRTTRQVLQVPALVVIWHWRIRFDERGAIMLMEELQRVIRLAARVAGLGKDEVPIDPTVMAEPMQALPGSSIVLSASVRPTTAADALSQGFEVSGAK